jgi:hydroxyacylglutathione hydrolase
MTSSLEITAVPCLRDNYAYIVAPRGARRAIVVDPSEAAPVERELEARGLELIAILNTHHHWDHVGGNEELLASRPGLPVYAHESDREQGRVPGQTVALRHEEAFDIEGMPFVTLHVPGHTLGAVTYCSDGAAFTGDTLFIAGCGRLFEGTPAMMHESLSGRLAKLPPDTRIYCGHEYTASNLRFAQSVEPENAAVAKKLAWAEQRRQSGEPTVPSTIADELATNPFLRVAEPTLAARFGGSPVDVLAAVRAAKDAF